MDKFVFINPYFNLEETGSYYLHFKLFSDDSVELRFSIQKLNGIWRPTEPVNFVWHDLFFVKENECPFCKTNVSICHFFDEYIEVLFEELKDLPEIRLHLLTN
jgi:hypothetical protein